MKINKQHLISEIKQDLMKERKESQDYFGKLPVREKLGILRDRVNKASFQELETVMVNNKNRGFVCRDNLIEDKSLSMTGNQNTNTNYLLISAELHDAFPAVNFDALNTTDSLWNMIKKRDVSMIGSNMYLFNLRTSQATGLSNHGAYLGNALATGSTGTKLRCETSMKKQSIPFSMDNDLLMASRGRGSDLINTEIQNAMVDFAHSADKMMLEEENTLEASQYVNTLKGFSDAAGNTTIYNGLTRSSYLDVLQPTTAGDNYVNQAGAITLVALRTAIQRFHKFGITSDKLLFVMDEIQLNAIRALYEAVGTNTFQHYDSRTGNVKTFIDDVPVLMNPNVVAGDIWLLNLDALEIVIWHPPQPEMLGKSADMTSGHVKCYWNLVSYLPAFTAVQIYGCT